MKKQILLFIPIFLLAFTMAVYAGETITTEHDLGTDNLVYTIIENSTIIPELNVSVNSTHIEIFFPYDTPVDTFKLIFIEEQTKEVIKEVRVSSGGGGKTKIKEVNNTIYVNDTRYIEVESENNSCSEPDNTEVPEETEESEKNSFLTVLYLIIAAIAVLVFLYKIISLLKHLYRDKKEDIEEEK